MTINGGEVLKAQVVIPVFLRIGDNCSKYYFSVENLLNMSFRGCRIGQRFIRKQR